MTKKKQKQKGTAADCPHLPSPARVSPGLRPLAPGPSAIPPAKLYRRCPIGPPGTGNLVDLLKRKELDPTNPFRL